MRWVSVAHVKTGALAAQTARPHRAQSALVAQFGQWIDLIEELTELRTSKELAHCCHHWSCIDQLARRDVLHISHTHPVHGVALHSEHTDAELTGNQLADQLDAAITQGINVISWLLGIVEANDFADDGH